MPRTIFRAEGLATFHSPRNRAVVVALSFSECNVNAKTSSVPSANVILGGG